MPVNPLQHPGEVFDLELVNPNPTSSKTKDGPIYRLSFEVPRETWDLFMEADTKGLLIAAKATVVDLGGEAQAVQEEPKGGLYRMEAQALYLSSFLRTPKVWRAMGTDAEFRAWVEQQGCAAAGNHPVPCNGDIVAAHVRRIALGAGAGIKPEYACIPLCDRHHGLQHQHGEAVLGTPGWWDGLRIRNIHEWGWSVLKAQLRVDSMADAPPAAVRAWAESREIGQFLPRAYRETA